MSDGLRPCPFCGREPTMSSYTYSTLGGGYVQFKVECENDNCPAQPTVDWHYWSEAEAAEAWNTRVERTCKAANVAEYAWDDFECSECGWVTWSFLMEHEGCGTVCQPRYCPNCGAKVVEA